MIGLPSIPPSFVILMLHSGDAMWAAAEEYNVLRGTFMQYVAGQISNRLLTFQHVNGAEVNVALAEIKMIQKHTRESYYTNQVLNCELAECRERARVQVFGDTADDEEDDIEEFTK